MRAAHVAAFVIPLVASPLAARDIVLSPPIACDLTSDCYVQQYVDHDPTDGASDFHCAALSYDTHQGTDFALRTLAQMHKGIDVIAAAPGTVRATRDGMADVIYTADLADEIAGRDCGNGVFIDHEDGWSTQYCHLKRGSVAVQSGDTVTPGTVLGQVGLSGRTAFPHVHMTLRKDDAVVDPYDPDGEITCGAPSAETLWDTAPPYQPGGILTTGFADAVPEFDQIKAGTATRQTLPADAPAIVLFGHMFGSQTGDVMTLTIDGPDGRLINQDVLLKRTQALLFRASGKKRTTPTWPTGPYTGTVTLTRDGREISTQTSTLMIE